MACLCDVGRGDISERSSELQHSHSIHICKVFHLEKDTK